MNEPDFAALAASLKQATEKPFKDIVEYFRTKFHGDGGTRFDTFLEQVGNDDFANSLVPLPSKKIINRAEIIGEWLTEARRGNQPAFRALLLKWLWIYDRETFALYEGLVRGAPRGQRKADVVLPASAEELIYSSGSSVEEHNPLRLLGPGIHAHPTHFSNRLIPQIIGREVELATLHRFVAQEPGFRWVQLAGSGGQGKSRMAYDLIAHVGDRWNAGFLSKDDLDNFQGIKGDYRSEVWRCWQPTKPQLIIFDYVIGREAEIGHAMDQLANRHDQFDVPVCALLLERQQWNRGATREGIAEWFAALHERGDNQRIRNDLSSPAFMFEAGIIELQSLPIESLVSIVRELVPQDIDWIRSDIGIQDILSRIDQTGSPLYAYFVAQAITEDAFVPEWEKPELLQYVFSQHLRKRWNAPLGPCPSLSDDHPAVQLAALSTMTQGVDCKTLPAATGIEQNGLVRRQAIALVGGPADGGPIGVGHHIPALEPDILGEWFALTAIENGHTTERVIDAAFQIRPDATIQFLLRALEDFPNHPAIVSLLSRYNETLREDVFAPWLRTICMALYFAKRPIPDHIFAALKKLCDQGELESMNTLSFISRYGHETQRDELRAFDLTAQAAHLGDAHSMLSLSYYIDGDASSQEEFELAAVWCLRAAEAGSVEAMIQTGDRYWYGNALPKDSKTALHWYTSAFDAPVDDERQHMVAAYRIAQSYEYGNDDMEKNFEQAVAWYRRGEAIGDSDAMLRLANAYNHEQIGLEQDGNKAFELIERAAIQGNYKAYTALGNCYAEGLGVVENPSMAAHWYRKSADVEDATGMFNLGLCYEEGYGVEQNSKFAKHSYAKALNNPNFRPPLDWANPL